MKKISFFLKKAVKLFNGFYPTSALLLLALIVFVSYAQIVNLYFWVDDWDLFLKVTHPELGLWGMDPGWFGSGPYKYLHTPFMPLFSVFGLNSSPYFAVEIVIYFTATISVFLLLLELTRKRSLSIGGAAIFASLGYIGSYTMFHLSNAYQNFGAIILTCLTLWILAKHYRTNKFLYYLFSIFLFSATLELVHIRAHGLVFLILGLTVLYCKWKKSIPNIIFNIIKVVPFILIYRFSYKATLGTVGEFSNIMSRDKLFAYFINPFASFSNVVIPDNITKLLFSPFNNIVNKAVPELLLVLAFIIISLLTIKKKNKSQILISSIFIIVEIAYFFFNQWAFKQSILFAYDKIASFTSILGMTILLSSLLVSIRLWKTATMISRAMLFGIILIFGNYIGYFVGATGYSYLTTTDRYLTPSTMGTALLVGAIFYLIKFKKFNLFPIFSVVYCLYLILLINFTVNSVINDISKPTKKFYETIKKITPVLPSKAVIFLDFDNNPNLRYQVYSSFPGTAFALFYNRDNRVPMVSSFDEYLYNIKTNKMQIADLVSYYISQWGVTETSKSVHNLLKDPTPDAFITKWFSNTDSRQTDFPLSTSPFISPTDSGSVGVNPRIEANVNYPSVVPMMLSATLLATPINLEGIKFPYYDVSSQMPDELVKEDLKDIDLSSIINSGLPCKETPTLLELDKERRDFEKYAEIETTSQARYSEKDFLTDNNFATNWAGFILKWASTKKEEVIIDLGQNKEVNKLIWVNYMKRTTPVEYNIFVSDNKSNWKKVKEIRNGPGHMDGEFVVDEFPRQNVRFVKMVITNTFGSLAPAISEIWVSSINNSMIKEYVQSLIDKPLLCPLSNIIEYEKIKDIIYPFVEARVLWLTDGRENYSKNFSKDLEIITDGKFHTYNIYIPAQATTLEKVMISDFQLPLNITIESATIRSLTFNEIDSLGYIRIPEGKSN